jgi:hypothetical protein
MVRLSRIRVAEDLERLKAAAAADDHRVIGATHLALKGSLPGTEEIAGYASCAGLPMLHAWASTGKGGAPRLTARESLELLRMAETLLAEQYNGVILPCSAQSPFYGLLPKLGYECLGETVLWAKALRVTTRTDTD